MATVSPELVEEKLGEDGYAAINFKLTQQDQDDLFSAFNAVIAESEESSRGHQLIEAITYRVKGREADGDYYLVKRVPGDKHPFHPDRAEGTEHKYTAHIGPQTAPRAAEYFRGSKNVPANLSEFLVLCEAVHEATKTATRPIYEALGIDHIMLADDPSDDVHIVRLLRYLNTAKEKPKAALHFDRSVATLAITESMSGLIGVPGNNGFDSALTIEEVELLQARALTSPVDHFLNEAKFFLGAGYNHLRREQPEVLRRIPLFLHGVSNIEPTVERDAVVAFMNPRIGVSYTVPNETETGLSEIRAAILRRRPPYDEDQF